MCDTLSSYFQLFCVKYSTVAQLSTRKQWRVHALLVQNHCLGVSFFLLPAFCCRRRIYSPKKKQWRQHWIVQSMNVNILNFIVSFIQTSHLINSKTINLFINEKKSRCTTFRDFQSQQQEVQDLGASLTRLVRLKLIIITVRKGKPK